MGSIPQLSIIKGPTRKLTPTTLDKLIENVASTSSEKDIALIYRDNDRKIRNTSYGDLRKLSNKLARSIRQLISNNDLPRNSDGDYIIAVNMHPSDHLVIVLLAIWKVGAAYLPLDPTFPGARIEHIIREARPALVIFNDDSSYYLDTFKVSFKDLLNNSNGQSPETLMDNERLCQVKDDLAIVLYTSGSTGVPKGVRLPHRVIQNRLQWQFKRFPYTSTEKVCVFKTALTFVDSVAEIWGPLINGLSLLIVPKMITKDPEKLIGLLEDYKVERLVLVPSLLRSILLFLELQRNNSILQNLKLWICSGETLTVSLAEEFYKYFPENKYLLCNFYGSTEIMGDVTYHAIEGLTHLEHRKTVPIGLPVDNTMIYLLDKDYRPVKAGEVGELFVAGMNLAAGYVAGRDPDKFLENPLAIDPAFARLYRTGDFARIEKGMLMYEGRTDSQVKVRGHRVDLAEIEKAISTIQGVEKAVVLCYKPGEMSQAILAFVTSQHATMNEFQIEALLKDKLPSYMIPQVILVEKIPLLVNGKTDRQALLKSYENTNNNDDSCPEVEINYEGVKPRQMEAAKVLFETVASVLNRSARSAISINANFYEIGGNSLNSILTISKLNDQGYFISIGDFISAMDFGEVLLRMTSDTNMSVVPPSYSSELLRPEYKETVLDIVTTSFFRKADLEQWILSEISELDYVELIDALWEPLVQKKLSFIVKSETGKIIGAALNFDARDEPEVEIKSRLTVIFEFLESIEGPIRDNQLPPGQGTILHSFMMATHSSLNARENVAVIQYMEDEVLKLARERHFLGILTTNTSPLTQQLGTDVFKYQTLLDYQVNQFIASDKTKPFALAPDEQRAIVQWKPVK